MGTLALLEVLDRDGHARQSVMVESWPLLVGRDLDNDLVLSDPHVAGQHFILAATESGVEIILGDTRNGVQLGAKHLRGGERSVLTAQGQGIEFTAGATRLRLRLAEQPLAPELALAPHVPLWRRLLPIALGTVALVLASLFNTYLSADPGSLGQAIGGMLLGLVTIAALWSGAWALLSKTFAHQARFGWHLRVFLFGALALMVVGALTSLLAFALSWPWVSDFGFVAELLVCAVALYAHLLAVEPARSRLLKWVAATCALAGIGLTLWFNVQRTDQWGSELYMNHLFPPALRLAPPVTVDSLVNGLSTLQPVLDKKAKEPARGEDASADND